MNNVSVKIDNRIPRGNAIQKAALKPVAPSFGRIYGLKGTPSELEQINNLLKNKKIYFNALEFLTKGSKKIASILAGGEKSSEFIYLNPNTGQKNEIKKFQKDGLEFYGNIATDHNGLGLKYSTCIAMVNFSKPLPLKESIQKLYSLGHKIEHNGESFCFPHLRFPEIFSCEEVIKSCNDFIGGKIKGLKGYGCNSMAFTTDSDKVFKVSFEPNTPEIPKIYDIPVFDRKKIENPSGKNLFCVLEKNGKSWVETKITPEDEESLLAKIQSCGDMSWDYGVEQIAKIENKPFLVDAASAETRKLWGERD